VHGTTRALEWTVAPGEVDRAIAALWLNDTLGVETRESADGVRLIAWFPDGADLPVERPDWPVPSARLLADRVEAAIDWLAEYRRLSRPFAVGTHFWIDPGEPARAPASAPSGRISLRIPARGAFGTGTHASTRLIIELMEESPPVGKSVLDVGCGTGILCFAALRLGAAIAVGLDIELEAAVAAHENNVLNASSGRFFAGRIGALSTRRCFDLVMVNALPAEIESELDCLAARVGGGGAILVSGLLTDQIEAVGGDFAGSGFQPVAIRREGEWAAMRLSRGER